MQLSGRCQELLGRIGINVNGTFDKNRVFVTLPPRLDTVKEDDVSFWGFSYLPKVSEFDASLTKNGKTYNEWLMNDRNYKNPYAVHNMVLAYHLNEYSSMLVDLAYPPEQSYENMRSVQNRKWGEQRLERGIEYAKEGKYVDAIHCYNEAIELVPKYAEAYTARGAALVKMGKEKEGIASFETALRIDPHTPNAKQYLEKAKGLMNIRVPVVHDRASTAKRFSSADREPQERRDESREQRESEESTAATKRQHTEEIDKRLLELLKKDAESHSRSRSRSSHHRHRHRHHHHSSLCSTNNNLIPHRSNRMQVCPAWRPSYDSSDQAPNHLPHGTPGDRPTGSHGECTHGKPPSPPSHQTASRG